MKKMKPGKSKATVPKVMGDMHGTGSKKKPAGKKRKKGY